MRLAVLGFGLIGGSIARALAARGRGAWQVTAWSRDPTAPREALSRGVVAAVAPDPATAVRDVELVVLAAPPLANLRLLDEVAPLLTERDVTLSDVSSSQGAIAAAASRHAGLRFVGGHPMSGRERRGFGASSADLFEGRPWVVLPGSGARPEDTARVDRLARACGAEPLLLDPASHDEAVASVSHLPLLASVALLEALAAAPDPALARRLAAQGWRDMTRLAHGDPALGAGILTTNAAALAGALRRYRAALEGWQATLDALATAADAVEDGERSAVALERQLAALAEERPA
ncbi:MAG TPA: prephenate dehydrogenase/arogenate dehydrogenase family protein [Candidatus Limnocylindrales bacterium]|nr:prephenate dehydrogenase/arogenate dehydrogenase family protein [Candidatus Limnocylindrales bacterium]